MTRNTYSGIAPQLRLKKLLELTTEKIHVR